MNGATTGMATIQAVTKTTRQAWLTVATVSPVAKVGACPTAMCLGGTTPTRTAAETASVSALFVAPTSVGCFVRKLFTSSAYAEERIRAVAL